MGEMDLGSQKLKGASPASRRSACGGPASPAAPRGSLCASFHSPAPMAISWVFAIGPSLDAVKRSFLIGRKTSHASTAATTTAMCSTVGLPHWPAASLHLAFPLPLPIGCPGRGSALPTSIGQRGARRGLGRVKSTASPARAPGIFDGRAGAGGGLLAGAHGDARLHHGLRPYHRRSGERAGRAGVAALWLQSLAGPRGLGRSPVSGVLHASRPTAAGTPQPLPALLQPAPGVPEVPGEVAPDPGTCQPGPGPPAPRLTATPPLRRSGGSSRHSSSSGPWDSASSSTCSSCILGHGGGVVRSGWGRGDDDGVLGQKRGN